MRLLQVHILRKQVGELPQSFPRHCGGGVLEIDDFLEVCESAAVVEDVIAIVVLPFEGDVVKHELSAVRGEGFGGDGVGVLVLTGTKQVLLRSGLQWLSDHVKELYQE